ncbi:MAG: hypothetical protein HY292_09940 [Planctomycetes bacterium]|nr:hypothetical protein [Planctomycetota bacterium]
MCTLHEPKRFCFLIGFVLTLSFATRGAAQNSCFEWTRGAFPSDGVDDVTKDFAVYDDGTGAALYAAGAFRTAGGTLANYVARWNGTSWSPLGLGLNAIANVLAVFDDGTGPALYVGGNFTNAAGVTANHIAKWNGTSWSALGAGTDAAINDLVTFDDGTGSALFATGYFSTAGGAPANGIARWNGSAWSALAEGISGGPTTPVGQALAVFDDGTGPGLYVGGAFLTAGQVVARSIARWNGTAWSALRNGLGTDGNSSVYALATFDAGSGTSLYVGGSGFTNAGSIPVNNFARWNGTTWSAVGSGTTGAVYSLASFDDGTGPALYVGGLFSTINGVTASGIARFKASAWSSLSNGVAGAGGTTAVQALRPFDDGTGPSLFVGGNFKLAGGIDATNVARWTGSVWSALPSGLDGSVNATIVFDDGSGPALFAGGGFTRAGGVALNYAAKWNGTSWSSLGSGVGPSGFAAISCFAEFDDGTGPALYAGGIFTAAGGAPVMNIARWNGIAWSDVGGGVTGTPNGFVSALAVFDDGGGPALYAGGTFTSAGGVPANHIARWNGSTWSSVGGGVDWNDGSTPFVSALQVFDAGTGPVLYATGSFNLAGGVSAIDVAGWNGSAWSPLGSGLGLDGFAFTVFDDGTGPALIVGGVFGGAGGVQAGRVAKWNGNAWSALGSGVGQQYPDRVFALAV